MKIRAIFFLSIGLFLSFLFITNNAQAAVCSDYSYLNAVGRDSNGQFITDLKAELYEQVLDANNQTKPGKRITSATANDNTGIATLKFKNSEVESAQYVLRLQSAQKDFSSYWYTNITIACGETLAIEKTLSAIEIVVRDYNDTLLYNTDVSIYIQKLDVDANPVKESKDLVAKLNTGATGAAKVYVPQGSVHSLDNSQGDYYVAEITRDRKVYPMYDIRVTEGQTTSVTYRASAMKVYVRNSLGALFPGGTAIEVYKQTVDGDNDQVQGDEVGDFETNDDGYGIFSAPAGVYVLAYKNSNNQYEYLWDVEIWDSQLNEYTWNMNVGQNTVGTCSSKSQLSLSFSGLNGEPLSAFKYEIYEQGQDTFGRSIAANKVASGSTNSFGQAEASFKPDPRKNYVVRVYEKKADLGEFWFFDAIRFVCGENRSFSRSLPYLEIVLRDASGSLKKDTSFSIYEQAYNADNEAIKDKDKLIANLKTGASGSARIYVGGAHPFNQTKRGLYIFSVSTKKSVFDAYNIAVDMNKNTSFEYIFSDLSLTLKSASGQISAKQEVKLYEQLKDGSNYRLGELLSSDSTDDSGYLHLEYPAGVYALVIKDDLGQSNIFWNLEIKDRQTVKASLNLNLTQVSLMNSLGELMSSGTSVDVYSLFENKGLFYRDKKVGTIKLGSNKQGQASLTQAPYLLSYIDKDKQEYGIAFWAENNKVNKIELKVANAQKISANQSFKLTAPALSQVSIMTTGSNTSSNTVSNNTSSSLSNRLAGRILLQVQDKGQAWYVSPKDKKRYYLANGASAFQIMRQAGVGITNNDLKKIPIGLDSRFNLQDSDGDLLADGVEVALGTDPYHSDTDKDGYLDGEEVRNSYNPLGSGNLSHDNTFTTKQLGKIFLQVEKNGEAWYVNPADSKRYYLGDGASAFEIMRFLSLGITNEDLNSISIGQ